MMSHVGRSVWIPGGRRLFQGVYTKCVKCTRFASRPTHQQMAPLPASRLMPQRAFLATGIDYAGPISVKCSQGRGIKTSKRYIVIFVCLVTKAVHIKIISDLTTSRFLAAYNRFSARRGHSKDIFSNNATTFHGAAILRNSKLWLK